MGGPGVIDVFLQYYPLFLECLWGTLYLAFIAVFFGTLFGAIIAMLQMINVRYLKTIIKSIMVIIVTILRGTPLLVQLFIAYFFLPLMFSSINLTPNQSVIIALSINSAAYVSEIIRGGINAVDKGQTEAARSLGMNQFNCLIRIILPQAIKNIIPSLGNEYIMMVKETSLAGTFMLTELMYARTVLGNKFLYWQPLIIIALIYLVVTIVLTFIVSLIEKRLAVSD